MAGQPAPLGDVKESMALSLLDDLLRAKKLTEAEASENRSNYTVMHNRVNDSREKEKALRILVSNVFYQNSTPFDIAGPPCLSSPVRSLGEPLSRAARRNQTFRSPRRKRTC